MELNHRQQNKFSSFKSNLWVERVDGSKRDIYFVEVEKAIKDFCYIRHELTNYSFLYASQLSFNTHLNLPYWEYLFIQGQINKSDKDTLEEGALLTIYLLFSEIFEAEGFCYIFRHNLLDTISKSLVLFEPDTEKKQKIVEKIKFSLDNYEKLNASMHSLEDSPPNDLEKILIENDDWVYNEFVEKCFFDIANSFELKRQKTKEFNEIIKNGGL